MKVSFFATLRDITGIKDSERFQAATVEELLNNLCVSYGEKFAAWIWEQGQLSNNIMILVNGRAIHHLNGIQTRLKATDEIAIFPKVAGG
ncbi:MAG TPA: ubiquitin-like small modifier protein 1 [Desulfobacteria bacterium]|nr:ubiquitin-like small modifier protein 1 [Desulfobacteria bacterium]